MAEVKVKDEADLSFGYDKPEAEVVHRFLNTQRVLLRESKVDTGVMAE